MQINNFRGDLSDTSAKKTSLSMSAWHGCSSVPTLLALAEHLKNGYLRMCV